LLASGSLDNTIKLWRVADGSLVRTLKGHTDEVLSVSFSPDGRLLASGSKDGTIKLWRVADGSLVRTLTRHRYSVRSVSFSPDGRLLASGSWDNTIKLWRVADGALLQTYNQETFGAFSIQFSSDGRLFGYGRADATVVVARNPFWQSGEGNPQPKNVKPPRGNTPPQRRHDKTDLRAGLSVRRGRTAANLAATGMARETTQAGGGLLPTALPKFVDAQDSNPPSPRLKG
jgi:dipeptidyl aminopeptidase/acylaminoacyl peptidase